MVEAMVLAGLRRCEVLGLRLTDLDVAVCLTTQPPVAIGLGRVREPLVARKP
jgi:hypothetical protein